MTTDFNAAERRAINGAWFALERCAEMSATSVRIELADSLKYETGSRTAGRPRIWAKALILDAYYEGALGSTEKRRTWLYMATGISRGIRYGYLLACGNALHDATVRQEDMLAQAGKATDALASCHARRRRS